MSSVQRQVEENNQILFVGTMIVLAVVFAAGFSVTLFGLTTPYMATAVDRWLTVGVGGAMILASAAGAYLTIK